MNDIVSVVIPSYNYARFLPVAIDSVLRQSYRRVECVVVDDGSTDDTMRVLREFERHVTIIRQMNSGLSAARNNGIRHASGDILALLDADDYFEPDKIRRQMDVLLRRPELGAVGCGYRVVDSTGRVLREHVPAPEVTPRIRRMQHLVTRKFWVSGSGSGALIPRTVLARVGSFDQSLRAAEDWDLWLRIGAEFAITNVDEILVTLRAHGTGTFRNPGLMEENQLRVLQQTVARWPEMLDLRTRRRARGLIAGDAAAEHLAAGDIRAARRNYWRAALLWPTKTHYLRSWLRLELRRVGV